MKFWRKIVFGVLLVGCAHSQKKLNPETQRLNEFLDAGFNEMLEMHPEFMTALGKKKGYSKLNDYSEAFADRLHQWNQSQLQEIKKFDPARMDEQGKISWTLAQRKMEQAIANNKWRDYYYPVNQMYGAQTELPTFMMNMHRVDEESDIKAYVERLRDFARVFSEVEKQMERSEKKGILPPRFVYPYVLDAAENVIKGAPFTRGEDSPLWADYKTKLNALKLSKADTSKYLQEGEEALMSSVLPSYKNLISFLKKQEKRAKTTAGVWKFPRGGEFYQTQIKNHTTTDMSADQVHRLGLANVERIHRDMKGILKKLNYAGTLQSFFNKLRQDPQFYFENTAEGRQAYLDLSKSFYQKIQPQIPKFFRLLPKAAFEIRAVESFRENSAGVAFYERPSEDGRRPGVYYVNLKEMRNLPKHEAEVVLYHEGAPGHHFQIAIAQELKGLPMVRKFDHYTAFSEGWGLYTERLAKEMGAYNDLYSEFGRLSLELLRASRLVIDTGLHSQKWTRERALSYMKKNLPGALEDQKNEVERYIVMPGQATAYMVGMLKIVELREKATQQLGTKFDVRDFHDVVLGNGPLPLEVLEKRVMDYIQQKQASAS